MSEDNKTCVNRLQPLWPSKLEYFVGNEHKSSRITGPEQCTQRSSCSFGSCPSPCWDWRALGPCGGMSCTSVQLGATKSPPELSVSEQSPVAESHSSPPQKQLSAIAHIPFIFFTFLTISHPCITCRWLKETTPPKPSQVYFSLPDF